MDHRGLQTAVTEVLLNDFQRHAGLEQVRRVRVSQRMDGDLLLEFELTGDLANRFLDGADLIEILEERLAYYENQDIDVRIAEARIELRLIDGRRTQSTVTKPPNIAAYTRDGDADVIELFLHDRNSFAGSKSATQCESCTWFIGSLEVAHEVQGKG